METDAKRLARLKWKCRRGMLELDFLLERFVKNKLTLLDDKQLQLFDRLLDEPDPVLLSWFMEHDVPEDKGFQAVVQLIIGAGPDADNKK